MGVAERRQREREERRDSILDAAEQTFLDKGVVMATMDEVAQRAEVSKGTLYLYFRSKDDLYLTIITRTLTDMVEVLRQAATGGGTGLERYRSLLRAHIGFALEHPARFRIGIGWLNTGYSIADDGPRFAEYRALMAESFALAVNAIEEGKQDGSIVSPTDSEELAMQIGAAVFGLMVIQANRVEVSRRLPKPMAWDRLVDSFVELISSAIARAEPAS